MYPPGTHPGRETMRFHGKRWPQSALDRDWHEWGWKLFHHAAFVTAPWPQEFNNNNAGGRRFDHMSVTEWIDTYIPGGVKSDFGSVCIAAVLDEYGGPADEMSALNLVYLLGQDSSTASGAQPHPEPELGGADEKWHIHGGNDQLITGLLERLPRGVLHLGERLVAIRPRAGGGYRCSFQSAGAIRDVTADHVVLALPFTLLRSVDLSRVPDRTAARQGHRHRAAGQQLEVFLQFSSRVWDEEGVTGNCFDDGIVQGGWDATYYQPGERGRPGGAPGRQERAGVGTALRPEHVLRRASRENGQCFPRRL